MRIVFVRNFFNRHQTVSAGLYKLSDAFIHKSFAPEWTGRLQQTHILIVFFLCIKEVYDMFDNIYRWRIIFCQVRRSYKWYLYRGVTGSLSNCERVCA